MKRLFLWLLLAVLAALVAVSAFAIHRFSALEKNHASRLEAYRSSYSAQIAGIVASSTSPESSADVHAYLSGDILNELLAMLVGPRLPLSSDTSIEFRSLKFTSENGTPLISIDGKLHLGKMAPAIDVQGEATFAPAVIAGGTLTTRLHIIALSPTFAFGKARIALTRNGDDLLKVIGQEHLDKLPPIALPIRHELALEVKGGKVPVKIKTRPKEKDTLYADISLPDLELKSSLNVVLAVCLKDGLHLFMKDSEDVPSRTEDSGWTNLNSEERLNSLSQSKADFFAKIHIGAIERTIQRLTSLPDKERTIKFVSTGLKGNLYYWKNEVRAPVLKTLLFRQELRVFLKEPDSLSAQMRIDDLKLKKDKTALIGFQMRFALSGKAGLRGHFDPGPTKGAGGTVDLSIPREKHRISGAIRLKKGDPPVLEASLDGKKPLEITLKVEIGKIIRSSFDFSVPLSKVPPLSSPVPTGLTEVLQFRIGENLIQRNVTAKGLTCTQEDGFLSISGGLSIEPFKEPGPYLGKSTL